jgi:hypothetical protein
LVGFFADPGAGPALPAALPRSASLRRCPRDKRSEAAWALGRHRDRHLTEEQALANAPEGTASTPAPDGQDKHRCAQYPHCIEHGGVLLTAAISVRSEEGTATTLWGAEEASSKAHNSPRIALCCGWQVAGTGCRGCGAPVDTNDRVFQYTAEGWQDHPRLDRQGGSAKDSTIYATHGCAASGTQCSYQQLAHGQRAGLPADDGAPNCIYCTPNSYAETADALGGEEVGSDDAGGSASSGRGAGTAVTEAHTPETAQKHTYAPNTQGEGSGMSPAMYALFMEGDYMHMLATAVFLNFAQAFPCTARSAPSAGRGAHHLTAYEAQHGYTEVRDSLNEPEYSMNEEGDGPSNRTKRLARPGTLLHTRRNVNSP